MTSIHQQEITIRSGERKLAADLSLASKTAPLLVFVHGFAGDRNEKGLFTEARDYFVERGFSVLRFDFQACGDSTGSFRRVRLNDLVDDLQSVFSHIRSDVSLSSVPVGLVGFSLGAGIGLLAGVPVATYIFWSPAIYTKTDMVPRYKTELDCNGIIIKGDIEVSKEFIHDLDSNAICHSLDSVGVPVLLIHGTEDQRIPWTSTERAGQRLARFTHAETVLVPGGDHSFRTSSQLRQRVFSASLDWLRRIIVVPAACTPLRRPPMTKKSDLNGHRPYLHG